MPIDTALYIHLSAPAGKAREVRHFYGSLLGLTEIRSVLNPASRRGVWFKAGTVQIHVGPVPEWPAKPGTPRIAVKDLVAVIGAIRLARHAVPPLPERVAAGRQVATLDPFGNSIVLVQSIESDLARQVLRAEIRRARIPH
jgi:catechol 2,3-dioxygenase-like lactoylglutathione lyase family enzyme